MRIKSIYRHNSKEWRQFRAERRATFLEQVEACRDGKGRLPGCTSVAQTKQRLKDIKADLAEFDQELRLWWSSPIPRAEDLADVLSRLTKAEVRYHERVRAELGLPAGGLLPGMLKEGWWRGRLMPAGVKRRLEARLSR